jgi:hypothetical protein
MSKVTKKVKNESTFCELNCTLCGKQLELRHKKPRHYKTNEIIPCPVNVIFKRTNYKGFERQWWM